MRAIEERKKLDELLAKVGEAIARRNAYDVYLLTTEMEKISRVIREKETGAYREEELAAAR